MEKVNKAIEASPFEAIRKWDENGHEYWSARALARILGYTRRGDFNEAIGKAQATCHISGLPVEEHFLVVSGVQELANGKKRKSTDLHLSRYACYLCIMNADPSKETVALGQAYMAAHTYLLELQKYSTFQKLKAEEEKRAFLRNELSHHNVKLAGLARSAGVITPGDFAIFQNHGYKGLYGGLDTKAIAARKGLASGQNLLDHIGSEELAANLFRVNLAEEILQEGYVKGVSEAAKAHYGAGKQVRTAIMRLTGTTPEALPAAQTIAHAAKDLRDAKKNSKTGTKRSYIRKTMKSIFTDQHHEPTEQDLESALGETYPLWKLLSDFTIATYPKAKQEWKYPGVNFGWGFRISDTKRVIVYLLPRNGFFKVALVFGQKATDELLGSQVADSIKEELRAAKVYKEGRGIRLEVKGPELLSDIEQLIMTKIAH